MSDQEFDDIPFFSDDQAVYQERDELKETVDHLEHELKRLRPKSKKDQLPPLPDFSEINREWLLAVRGAAVARLGDVYIRIPIESSILYLHNWHVQEILENVDEEMYVISAAYEDDAISCPECGSRSFVKFGTKVQHYHDTPIHGQRVVIRFRRQRFKCLACEHPFLQPTPPQIQPNTTMTKRLIEFIQRRSLIRTFSWIAEEVGVHEKSVRLIFNAYADYLETAYQVETPEWLGIDEVYVVRKHRCILVDALNRLPIDMLLSRDKESVIKWLGKLDQSKVKVVTMDMWRPYRDAVAEVLPSAVVIVDKFHVVKMANEALDTCRKALKLELQPNQRRQLKSDRSLLLKREKDLTQRQVFLRDTWLGSFPDLLQAYLMKEALFDLYEASSKEEAEEAYQTWLDVLDDLPKPVKAAYRKLRTSFKNWHTEIFNYFDHKATNAYSESLNNLVKGTIRDGRGYSFRVLRAKILYRRLPDQLRKQSRLEIDF